MLDIKLIRENPAKVQEGFRKRGEAIDLASLLKLDEERMSVLKRVEDLRSRRNKASDEIGKLKREGKSADQYLEQMKGVSEEIKQLEVDIRGIEEQVQEILLVLPNIPDESVPVGENEKGNI